eukprot:jgi/Chlat1/7263/Chrsp58S06898
MDDNGEDNERFGMENDYEGGKFIGDEFYFTKKRDKRKQTRDDQLYGVFNDSSDDDDGGKGGGRGRKRGRDTGGQDRADYSKPIGFVSSGKVLPTEPKQEPAAEPSERAGLGASGLGFAPSGRQQDELEQDVLPTGFGKQILERAQKRREAEQKKKEEERRQQGRAQGVSPSVGIFEQHTKGIGMKLLQKMGFTGKLGKDEQGIAQAIEVKMRPKNMGMGYNEYTEQSKTGLGVKAPLPEVEAPKDEIAAPSQKLWKKKNVAKRKVKYKTAAQLLEELEEQPAAEPTKVLDMRGPQVRVLTNLEHMNVEETAAGEDVPIPELQHNLRLIVDLAEADVQKIDRKLRHENDSIAILESERTRLVEEVAEHAHREERLQTALAMAERVASGGAALELEEAADIFTTLKTHFHEEYVMYSMASLALAHVMPRLSAVFQGWDPFAQPSHGLTVMSTWRKLLAQEGPADYQIFPDLDTDTDAYTRLIAGTLLPPLRSAANNNWDPRNVEPMVSLLELWEHILPVSVLNNILMQLVIPKLTRAVDSWDPRQETVPIHAWLHPWLPLLGAHMEPLYAPIRYKLGVALQAWHPSDASAYALLSPWKTVFDPVSWDQLLSRSIIPKLAFALQELVINPHQQVLEPFHWVITWATAVPIHHMVAIFEQSFFPAWHQVLYHWLSNAPNYDEVVRWYQGWKSLFPVDLQAHERIRAQFTMALDMMNQAVSGVALTQPGAIEHVSYLRATEQRRMEAQQAAPPPPRSQPVAPSTAADAGSYQAAHEMSFKELVEHFAQQNDVQFLPKVGRWHEGLQVYGFGMVSVVLDKVLQVIKAQVGDRWAPTSLEQLLELHRSRVSSRRGHA